MLHLQILELVGLKYESYSRTYVIIETAMLAYCRYGENRTTVLMYFLFETEPYVFIYYFRSMMIDKFEEKTLRRMAR